MVITTLVHLVHLVKLVNLVITTLGNLINMAFGLIWFIWWFILVNMVLAILVNLVNIMLCIWFILLSGFWIFGAGWICFTIQKTRKYFIETKIFIKIAIVLKNLFQSVREKVQSRKKKF